MLQKTTDYIDRKVLDEAKARQEFLNASSQEQKPQEPKHDFLNPDPIKLNPLKYEVVLKSGWCIVSIEGDKGHNMNSYEWRPLQLALSGKAVSRKYRTFEDKLPSYVSCKQVKAGEEPNHVMAYIFKDGQMASYPQEMRLSY